MKSMVVDNAVNATLMLQLKETILKDKSIDWKRKKSQDRAAESISKKKMVLGPYTEF